jgi:hypothetical protein
MPPHTMTLLVVGVAVAAMALLVLGRQIVLGTSDRRSVERYERGLDHLGEVARRTEAAPIRPTQEPGYAPIHLGPLSQRAPKAPSPQVKPKAPVAPRPVTAMSTAPLVFGDSDLMATEKPTASSSHPGKSATDAPRVAGPRAGRPRRSGPPTSPSPRHRAARVVAPALLVVAGAVVIGEILTNGSAHPKSSQLATRDTTGHSKTGRSVTPTTVAPSTYQPTNKSGSLVTYNIPPGAHTLSFSASGVCWVGIQASASGPYLWMDTIPGGSSATYAATSNVLVRIGAPTVVSLRVDGIPVAFPKGQTQPFDVALGPTSGSSNGTGI